MSFNVFQDDPSPARGPGAVAAIATVRRRRARQRAIAGASAAASLALVAGVVVALGSDSDGQRVVANEPSNRELPAATTIAAPTTSTPLKSTTTSTLRRPTADKRAPTTLPPPPPSTTSTSWYGQTWVSHPGTANLTFSGVRVGTLTDAVASCTPRPGAMSDLKVSGTLDGTPWVLYVQSYTGEMGGAYQVITGEAGGGTGMNSPGYYARETYPKTLSGVSNVDWAHGATLDLDLASEDGQTPAGTVHVSGSITCD